MAVEARDSHLAQVYFAAGRYAEALVLLEQLVACSTDPSYPCRKAMCLLALNRVPEAEAILQTVTTELPHYALARMLLGQTALMKGETAEAEAIFAQLRESEAEMPALHSQVGTVYLRRQRWAEAAELFRKALEADPDLAEAHDGLGVALRHLGQVEDSGHEHMQAVALQHDRPQSHINLGISLTRANQIEWAIRAFNVAADLAPNEPYPHRCLSRIYRRIKPDHAKARHHLLLARDLRRGLRGKVPAFRQGARMKATPAAT